MGIEEGRKAIAALRERCPEEILASGESLDVAWVAVRRDRILDLLRALYCAEGGGYDFLSDVCGADYLGRDEVERFAVVYHLYSASARGWVRVKAFVPEHDPVVPSASGIWANAAWGEREAFDMYGIRFSGHPDLRRILMPDDFDGYPLRKDYPLKGRGYRESFPVYTPEER